MLIVDNVDCTVLTGVDTVSDRPIAKPSSPEQKNKVNPGMTRSGIRVGPPDFPPQCLALLRQAMLAAQNTI